ncbi:hypothetical protein CcaverHIS002_0407930 [Cutaneotrichosporon cavernicola]|uniref:Uncharacterized protein n=1 Tax=Cutaneotrichosporon cavernicola TaxID=279322 RepID=A0AA48L4S6_9TREE|nr:uncharacterized protein CcaverHIS019_0407910 [Cutaneotrichosporon cavernicola]BEI84189.1 hypothetical protein CcaverHIS002_0407930 [Cutaneotrichosporon cavernicola]BEI91971.1 hypothetical protein CcaverHIS019_0407910 [Cutaneotrichosporon cavernicola]BEI99742.1 hypothetical protein CcaverHIS631_0407850 [Cutaneotrichosporon cavernicola]BEJ07518.1 hypothetical protein CcaverHIS641_0407870 [Cutaneotrichosporon cavernicola]
MQSYIPYHLFRKPTQSLSDTSFEAADTSEEGSGYSSEEEPSEDTPSISGWPPCQTTDSGASTPLYQGISPSLSEATPTPSLQRTPIFTPPDSDSTSMIGSLLSIIASISENVSRMREHQERMLAAQDERLKTQAITTANASASVEEIRSRVEGMLRFRDADTVSASGDDQIEPSTNGNHPHLSFPPFSAPPQKDVIVPNGEGSTLLAHLDTQGDAIANLTITVESMLEHFESQTRSFRSQADSCAALADAAKREARGAGTHTMALKDLAEEVDKLGVKHMSALTNHGVTLSTLRASVDAQSNRLVALHKTVEGLRPPTHRAGDVFEAVLAVRSATAALERLALSEIATKNDTLASRTTAYTAEREKMVGEMAALRARCNEAESAARTQIQAKNNEVRKLVAERDRAKEEMFKTKEELYTATSQLCAKCTKRFESQRQQSWQY